DDVPALRQRTVRAGVPGAGDGAQLRRHQPAGLQPLHRHALLREQLPLQGAAVQLVRVRAQRPLRLPHEQRARRDGAQPRRRGAIARRDGEVQPLRAAHPGGEACRRTGRPSRRRRRHSDRVSAGLSGAGHRVRRPQQSCQPRFGAGEERAPVRRPRGSRHAAVGQLPDQGEERRTLPLRTLDQDAGPNARASWPRRWIDGSPALGQVTDDVARPLYAWPGRGWFAAFAVSVVALAVGAACVTYQVATGIGVWGLNRTVGWAFDITNFVFWIGIGHAGTLISAILLLFRQQWRTSINRSAEAMTIFAVMCAALFP